MNTVFLDFVKRRTRDKARGGRQQTKIMRVASQNINGATMTGYRTEEVHYVMINIK